MRLQRHWLPFVLLLHMAVALAAVSGLVPGPVVGAMVAATGCAWAYLVARSHAGHRQELIKMAHIAALAQAAIIRPLPARLGGMSLAVHTRSATDDALIGGDLYDAVGTATGLRLIVGDVKGNGLDAVHLTAAVLASFRQHAPAEPDLARLAELLDADLAPHLGTEDFVTVLLAEFAPAEVRLVNCGHPAPLRAGRRLELLEPPEPAPPLGLSPRPRPARYGLSPSQRLLLYTDGLTEARNADGVEFPLDQRLATVLAAPALDHALGDLVDLLDEHVGGAPRDDLTVILAEPAQPVLAPRPAPMPAPVEREL